MGKKRVRGVNRQPFLGEVASVTSSRKPSKKASKLRSSDISSKIVKEALAQQREVEAEENADNPSTFAFAELGQRARYEEEDDFDGFSQAESLYDNYQEEGIHEEQEKLVEAFFAASDCTLADIIMEKTKGKDSNFAPERPELDTSVIQLYKGVGKFLSEYTSGRLPKAFKHIVTMECWEEMLQWTEPEKWSMNAMLEATRIFGSNFNSRKAERFYELVLLPRVREDIRKHRRLCKPLYKSLKRAMYKPAAFNKGILLPLCQSGTCSVTEAVTVGSVIKKVSIPVQHSSAVLAMLAEMEYRGTTSYFMKILVEKKYALPCGVIRALVNHFTRFGDETRASMHVIWHQSLLAFVQRYKNDLDKDEKDRLRVLLRKQHHYLITSEILWELDSSREKEGVPILPNSALYTPIHEDSFDIPPVPMEED